MKETMEMILVALLLIISSPFIVILAMMGIISFILIYPFKLIKNYFFKQCPYCKKLLLENKKSGNNNYICVHCEEQFYLKNEKLRSYKNEVLG